MAFLKQILAPTDFSRNSSHAVNYACDMAKQSGARLHLLHIVKGALDNGSDTVERLERIGTMVDAKAELTIETIREVIGGPPAKTIAKYARDNDIDLIVMGTHGRTGLAHLTMGSVAENVLRDSPCPVLILGPHDGETASLGHAAKVLAGAADPPETESLEDGRTRMHCRLVDELRIPATTAILLLDELEDRAWVKYEHGKWVVVDGTELASESEPFIPEFSTDTPAIDLVKRAKKLHATDLHIDPIDNGKHQVRLRIDGRLNEYCKLHGDVATHLINQLKTMANAGISDPFRPKESHLRLPSEFADSDIRMTTIPVTGGQAVALRLFEPGNIMLPLEHLGFSEHALQSVQKMMQRGEGLILVTGPTGSGKTTTVYSMLQSIGGGHQNIVSIEDPVEYAVPFVRQMSVDLKHGITMADGLRTILRMDPDIVFIGEIRDVDAATIGMRAASIGKYIFSTMHTRDVASTISALRDLGVENRTLTSNLTGIINQRLIRRLCTHCKQASDVTFEQKERFTNVGLDAPDMLFQPVGCTNCRGTGYHGRIGVFEIGNVTPELSEAITHNQPEREIEHLLRSTGSLSLESDALSKAASGIVSFEEAIGIRWLA